jgi:hypothetical protein
LATNGKAKLKKFLAGASLSKAYRDDLVRARMAVGAFERQTFHRRGAVSSPNDHINGALRE